MSASRQSSAASWHGREYRQELDGGDGGIFDVSSSLLVSISSLLVRRVGQADTSSAIVLVSARGEVGGRAGSLRPVRQDRPTRAERRLTPGDVEEWRRGRPTRHDGKQRFLSDSRRELERAIKVIESSCCPAARVCCKTRAAGVSSSCPPDDHLAFLSSACPRSDPS